MQVPERQRLTHELFSQPAECSTAWTVLLDGVLAVVRARERGEPWWALDVRRAQARVAAQRASLLEARTRDQAGES